MKKLNLSTSCKFALDYAPLLMAAVYVAWAVDATTREALYSRVVAVIWATLWFSRRSYEQVLSHKNETIALLRRTIDAHKGIEAALRSRIESQRTLLMTIGIQPTEPQSVDVEVDQ